ASLTALALSCLCRRGLTLSSLPQGQCSTGYVSVTASLLAKPSLSSFQAQKAKHRMPAKQNQQQGAGKQQAADANKDAKQQKQQQQQQQAGGAAAKAGQKK
ncbi:hypothetical protein BOX15_Mlig001540g3, partial [Macrostomum lignano]